jgi:hypothetical protein
VSIRNCCNRPIIKNCYLEKGIAFIKPYDWSKTMMNEIIIIIRDGMIKKDCLSWPYNLEHFFIRLFATQRPDMSCCFI